MASVDTQWSYLPEHLSAATALATPRLWEQLGQLIPDASDPATLTLAVSSRQPRIRQQRQLTTVLVRVRQANKAELREAGRESSETPSLLLPKTLASHQRQVFGPHSSSEHSRPRLTLSLSHPVPLSSVILFAVDQASYVFACDHQDTFLDRIGGISHESGELVREGDTLRLREGRWKVAMTEPVLQGTVSKDQTRVIVLPPSGREIEDEDEEEEQVETVASASTVRGEDRHRTMSSLIDEDDTQEEDEDDFEIDESFLANSVLTNAAQQTRYGQTPLTSPLSTSSKQRQFFPLGELSLSSIAKPTLLPLHLRHPIPSELLSPVPDEDEDDVPRAFILAADLGRIGLFSGDWTVLRRNDMGSGGEARLVKVFAADGLVELESPAPSCPSIQIHLPPPLLHNLVGPSQTIAQLSLEPAPSVSSILPPSLPTAASVTLARIASPYSVNKIYQPLFLEGLKNHFQNRKRIVKKGDVIAIAIEEGRARYLGTAGDGKEEPDEYELPAANSVPTAVVHFVVTALSLPPELVPPTNDTPIDFEEDLGSGSLGCYVDPKVTKLLQSGVEKSRVPDDGGWLGLPQLPIFGSTSTANDATAATRLHDFVSAALAPNASSYDLPLSVLVKGARGCGKRTMVYSVARRLGVHVLEVDAYDLLGDTDAKTEGRLQALAVDKALACAPCVLILRNIEALARKSQALETGQEPAMTTVLRESFSTIRSGFVSSSQPVIVLGTTTDADKLPTGVIGLFKEELSVDAPGEPERLSILRNLTRSEHLAPDVALRNLAVQTAALVANDLVDLVRRAKAAAAERVLSLLASSSSSASPRTLPTLQDLVYSGISLTSDDFAKALEAARSSYSESIGAPKIPNVTWDDVGGLANVKSDILDTIQLPLEKPELFADGLKKRSGILLYGPPGTGKTLLAKAVATSCSLNFFSVKGPELLNMYIGESEANVRRVFQRARDAKPCVIFFDELDSVAPKRGNQGDSGGVMDRIVSQLLAELDGMSEGKGGANDVFVIGATNRPDLLDPALLRPGRFDRMLYLGISETHQAQLKIIEALTRKFKLEPEIRLDLVAEQCPFNYTGADFYALCSDAMLKAMSRKAEDIDRKIADLNSRPPYSNGQTALLTPQYYLAEMATPSEIEVLVAQQDFEAALAELIPSVSPQELSHYKQVRAKFATETMNSDDKMEKKQQQVQQEKGLVKANGVVAVADGNGHVEAKEESEDEEEQRRRSAAKGKGKAREQ